MTSDLRSAPIITLSLASSNSTCVTMRLLRRAAIRAASLTRFMRSAPEKPGVPRAMVLSTTSGATGTLRTCASRICSPPPTMAAACLDFVEQDDAGRVLLGLLEHVAPAASADADEHFAEVGAGNREER